MSLRITDPADDPEEQSVEDQFEVLVDAGVYDAAEYGGDLAEIEATLEHYTSLVSAWRVNGLPARFDDAEE